MDKNNEIIVFRYVKHTLPLLFKIIFPKVDQYTTDNWLNHGTKHCKDINSPVILVITLFK